MCGLKPHQVQVFCLLEQNALFPVVSLDSNVNGELLGYHTGTIIAGYQRGDYPSATLNER